MDNEKIKLRITESGQTIGLVIGEGVHNMECADRRRPAMA